jgi:hypothetical protein
MAVEERYGSGAETHFSLWGGSTIVRKIACAATEIASWDGLPKLGDTYGATGQAKYFRVVDIDIMGVGKPTDDENGVGYTRYEIDVTYSTDHGFSVQDSWEFGLQQLSITAGRIWDDGWQCAQDINVQLPCGEWVIRQTIMEGSIRPRDIALLLGCVNGSEYRGFAPDTLLFTGMECERVFCPGPPRWAYRITWRLQYREDADGHNHQWVWREFVEGPPDTPAGWHKFRGADMLYPQINFDQLGINWSVL